MLKDIQKKISLGVIIGGVQIDAPSVNSRFNTVEGILMFVTDALNWFIGFAVVVAVIMLIYGGFLFITAAGDPEKISGGQKAVAAAIVGLVIVFLARLIVLFVLDMFL